MPNTRSNTRSYKYINIFDVISANYTDSVKVIGEQNGNKNN